MDPVFRERGCDLSVDSRSTAVVSFMLGVQYGVCST